MAAGPGFSAIPGSMWPGAIWPGNARIMQAGALTFTFGEPYFQWAAGTPYVQWAPAEPDWEWAAGSPVLS